MTYYNVSNISSVNGIGGLFSSLNVASNYFLAPFVLMIIFAIIYISLLNQDSDPIRALLVSIWVVFLLATFFLIRGDITPLIWGMLLVGNVIVTIASFHR